MTINYKKKVFTSGDVAHICNVCRRTASSWFDRGLLKGYRIPGSGDRRVTREELIQFLKHHEIPLGQLQESES